MNLAKLIRAALAALSTLLTQCRSLMDANDSLGARCSSLQAENDSLRSQLLVVSGSTSTTPPADPPEVLDLQNWLTGNGFATDVDPITDTDTQAVLPDVEPVAGGGGEPSTVSESPVVDTPVAGRDENGQSPANPPIPR